jgi:hypothetical protein
VRQVVPVDREERRFALSMVESARRPLNVENLDVLERVGPP